MKQPSPKTIFITRLLSGLITFSLFTVALEFWSEIAKLNINGQTIEMALVTTISGICYGYFFIFPKVLISLIRLFLQRASLPD